jgi:hypothetical protein
MEHALGGK